MSRQKWQQRYADARLPQPPCWLLNTYSHWLPDRGYGLDVACGLGGNAMALARAGLTVDALDYADNAVDKLNDYARREQLSISAKWGDLESQGLHAEQRYDVIVVSYYLHRPLLAQLADALAPGGLLFYQTFNSRRPALRGPSNPDFLLGEGELSRAYAGLETLLHREDLDLRGPEHALQTGYIGRKPATIR
ncbi:class I SAM-dependent methyltransferase [Spongiibacter sp.]|uniref:class I SAM-dependent methyltransferase n=1 Tax=Spongiibacter sp. TaxID=2024860 RepID=UPI002580E332|nr:class I SAM-dependent methyltransferase [Spongiibacter sp.]